MLENAAPGVGIKLEDDSLRRAQLVVAGAGELLEARIVALGEDFKMMLGDCRRERGYFRFRRRAGTLGTDLQQQAFAG